MYLEAYAEWYDMAIGRYRDDPEELDELEQRVAAAQYPEGGVALGGFLGVALAYLTVDMLVVVAPFVGGILGFSLGRLYRKRRLAQLRDRPE